MSMYILVSFLKCNREPQMQQKHLVYMLKILNYVVDTPDLMY